MSVLKGAISIKDNATAVLRNIKKEQSAFRQDVEKTKQTLKSTWDKKRTARLDSTAAQKAATQLKSKLEPLRKKVTTAVALKDMATDKVKAVGNKIKAVGKMAAKPLIAIKDATAAGLSKVSGALKSVAKTVAIPVTVATTAVVGGAISEGSKLEQSMGGVKTLFKDNSGIVKANADKAFRTAGLSANDYMETVTSVSASLLQSLGGDTAKAAGVADMAIVDMADNANKFGTDMESIQNAYQGFAKQNYTMLDNLKLGYGGTKEEMQRLLSDASKLTGVEYNIDNLSDVYNAIHAIQGDLGVTGTTAKEAASTFSGSFASMKSAAKNVLGNLAIGGDVTGSMEALVDSASTFLFNNAIPMIGRVISSLPGAIMTAVTKAGPKIKAASGGIIKSLKDGLKSMLPDSMSGIADSLFSTVGNIGNSFAAILPQLTSFGGTVMSTIQQVVTAVMPAVDSIINTITSVIPPLIPVVETVVSTIGDVIGAAAPVISGLVEAIGTVISDLAPVFQTIFDGIGQKVQSVLEFVGSKMGWIQEVIATVMPVVQDILTTAWSVISPVIDIAINVFKTIFNVVQRVFPGIMKVIQTVWNTIKPVIDAIADGLSWVADKVGGLFSWFGGSGGGEVGANAEGTNNWRGGVTVVGERGPELVDLPRGSRILPNKESAQLMKKASQPVVNQVVQNNVAKTAMYSTGDSVTVLEQIKNILTGISGQVKQDDSGDGKDKRPTEAPEDPFGGFFPWPPTYPTPSSNPPPPVAQPPIQVTIAKLADELVVREESDIDRIGEAVANEVVLAIRNLVPA